MIAPVALLAAGTLASVGVIAAVDAAPISDPALVAWGGIAALPLVVGIVEVLKRAGLPQRWAGLAGLLLGVTGGIVYGGVAGLEPVLAIPQGLLIGLAASGAWSTTKHAVGRGGGA